ncbi:nuclear pore complex protein [Trifolium repens]|nr:nuclear pore complex protein [Trifolium repens]
MDSNSFVELPNVRSFSFLTFLLLQNPNPIAISSSERATFLLHHKTQSPPFSFSRRSRSAFCSSSIRIFLLRALAWLIPKFLVRWFVAATDVFRCVLVDLFIVARVEIPNHERYFLSQLQSRGFLRSCLNAISNISNQDGGLSLDSLQSRGHVPMRLNLLYY